MDLSRLFRSLSLRPKSKALRVKPQCLYDHYHFLAADGTYYPCCFLRTGGGRRELHALLGEDVKLLNAAQYTRAEILRSRAWAKLLKSFRDQPLPTCLEFCPKERGKAEWGQFNGQHRYVVKQL